MTRAPLLFKKAVFLTSMKTGDDYPGGDKPEIAVAGKSNVGKSSLINFLCNNSKLAHTSKQPGKTRLVNFFAVNDSFYLVDLPGYGFARVSKAERKDWGRMMDDYFGTSQKLAALVILMDIRHDPTGDDIQMVRYALHYGIPFAVAATKADKVAKSKRFYAARQLKQKITAATGADRFDVIPVSSLDKVGKEQVCAYLAERLDA